MFLAHQARLHRDVAAFLEPAPAGERARARRVGLQPSGWKSGLLPTSRPRRVSMAIRARGCFDVAAALTTIEGEVLRGIDSEDHGRAPRAFDQIQNEGPARFVRHPDRSA